MAAGSAGPAQALCILLQSGVESPYTQSPGISITGLLYLQTLRLIFLGGVGCWCCSLLKSCPALCHPMDCSTPGFAVLHHLLEFAQNSCLLSWWCHPTISSSVVPFFSPLQSFPASGSFQMSQFFTSGGQSTGASASASVLPMNIQDWSPLGWTGWISLQSKGLSKSLLQHHSSKVSILRH